MHPATILLCLGTLTGGILLGWPRPVMPSLTAPAAAVIAAAKAVAMDAKAPPKANNSLTMRELDGYRSWLEQARPAEVLQDILAVSFSDPLRAALAKSRFLKFPPAERVTALLELVKTGKARTFQGYDEMVADTVKESILTDPAGTAQLMSGYGLPEEKLLQELLSSLFARDGWSGMQAFLEKLSPEQKLAASPAALALLAVKDPASAQSECLKIPEGKDRNASAVAVASLMIDTDPKAAFDWLTKYTKTVDEAYYANAGTHPGATLLQKIFETNPVAGQEILLENQQIFSGMLMSSPLGSLFSSWSAKDFAGASAWLEANPLGDRLQSDALRSVYQTKLQSLSKPGAAGFYQQLTPLLQELCAPELLNKVGMDGLPGGLEAFRAALSDTARSRFDQNLDTLRQNANDEDKKRILTLLGPNKVVADYAEKNEIDELPEADQQKLLAGMSEDDRQAWKLKQAKIALNTADVAKAMDLLKELGPDPMETLPHAQVAVELSVSDPAAAVAWVDALPAGSAKTNAISNLAANWGKADLAGATQWVEGLPAGDAKDAALDALIQYHGLSGDTDTAIRLTQAIQNGERRLPAQGFRVPHGI